MKESTLVLALDTSHQRGSVAVSRGEEVLAEILFDASDTHSATLLPSVDACLRSAKAALADVDLIGVVSGPGSFTGIRIGLATAKAFAAVRRVPVSPVSSVEVLAAAFPYAAYPILPLIDARRGEVYGALFRTDGGAPREIVPLFAAKPETIGGILARAGEASPVILCGTGALRHREILAPLVGAGSRFASARWAWPSASLCAALALGRAAIPYESLFDLEPLYVRPPDARLPGPGRCGKRKGGAE